MGTALRGGGLVVTGAVLVPGGVELRGGGLEIPSAGGGGASWPATLAADTLYRYDASDADTLTLSGSDVTAWADLGPSEYDLSASPAPGSGYAQPTYSASALGGGPCVAFAQSGAAAGLRRENVSVDYSLYTLTIIAVYEPCTEARGNGAVIDHLTGGGAGPILYDIDTQRAQDGGVGVPEPRARAAVSRVPQVVIATLGPSVATLERNGVEVQTVSVNGTMTAVSSRPLTVGGDAEWIDQGARYVGLVCVVGRALTGAERTAVYDYCAAHWTT